MTLKEGSRRRFGFSGDVPLWRDERAIRAVAQLISAALLIGAVIWLVTNFLQAAALRGLPLGYDFLSQESGFPIGESVIEYDPSRPFLYAFLAHLRQEVWGGVAPRGLTKAAKKFSLGALPPRGPRP